MSLKSKTPVADESRAATREQLLDAASEVFAELGFRNATVREICQRAGANIAAINYHFGDKEALYTEVVRRCMRMARDKYPPTLGLSGKATREQKLRAFVYSFLLRIFDAGPNGMRGRLILREMVDPTGALDVAVDEEVRPMAGYLMEVVREFLGPRAGADELRLNGMSVVSQVLFYNHCRPMVVRLFPDLKFDAKAIERLADHITAFSLAGLRQARGAAGKRKSA
jgi:TetR/AcrR family transcriptional regulator, regulator of cefoperazone and chloramphenicol sensitivity